MDQLKKSEKTVQEKYLKTMSLELQNSLDKLEAQFKSHLNNVYKEKFDRILVKIKPLIDSYEIIAICILSE